MKTQNIFVDACLQAGASVGREPGCPDAATLEAVADNCLSSIETRRVTMHLVACRACRSALAMLVSEKRVPVSKPVSLAALLHETPIARKWKEWFRQLTLKMPDPDVVAGDQEGESVPYIDSRGRLIVDLPLTGEAGTVGRQNLSLRYAGTQLDLCTAPVRNGRIAAVVDLSAFDPRPGALQDDVLVAEPAAVEAPDGMLLPLLDRLHSQQISGAPFWDAFLPVAIACRPSVSVVLVQEIAQAQGDDTVRTVPLAPGAATVPQEAAPEMIVGRVQYAISTLQEYIDLWETCNGRPLPHAHELLAELNSTISPAERTTVGVDAAFSSYSNQVAAAVHGAAARPGSGG